MFGWCFIGCGKLAEIVAEEILKSGKHKIVSVYSHSFDKCASFAARYGACAYRTAQEAINAEGVDGVYVVTPHNSHCEYSLLAVQSGKPVLCEKPITVDSSSAKQLVAAANGKGVYLAEAMWTWFSPVANRVKEWLDGGKLGKIEKVCVDWHVADIFAPRVIDPALAGGALLDIGVYAVAYLCRLFGKPQKISCSGTVAQGIDWSEEIAFTYPDGVYTVSLSVNAPKSLEELRIEGSRAKVVLPAFHLANSAALEYADGRKEVFSGDGSYLNEFNIVSGEILSGRKQSAFVEQAFTIEVMEILDECRRQLNLVYPFEK